MENKNAKIRSIIFIAVVALLSVCITVTIFVIPYDSGVLSPATLCGNASFGGYVADTADYLFYKNITQGQYGINRIDLDSGDDIQIYSGDVSFLYPYDGWVYFLENSTVKKTLYYGGVVENVVSDVKCTRFSLNGAWVFYLDEDGILYKRYSQGTKVYKISDDSYKITDFAVDNRMVIFSDSKGLYSMSVDGSDFKIIDTGNVTNFLYTLDELYYIKDSNVMHISSYAAGYDAGLVFSPVKAEFINYNHNQSTGRGMLYYYYDSKLVLRHTSYEYDNHEKDEIMIEIPGLKSIFVANGRVYFYNDKNELCSIVNNGEKYVICSIDGKDIN